jgi:hypothetical protein
MDDGGLAHLKGCESLSILNLQDTRVGDAGLAHLKGCDSLSTLWLGGTKVTDAGLAHLADCGNLANLSLQGTRVTGEGLAHLKGCDSLSILSLNDTKVGDEGLAELADCKGLAALHLHKTKVTDAKVGELKKALPGCKIEWDGGVLQATASPSPERGAAEYVLSLGGAVMVNGDYPLIKAAADLPRASFRLTSVDLERNKRVTDEGLERLAGCRSLAHLNLYGTQVGDAGLARR